MSRDVFEPPEVGPLHHHGPELLPVIDLIIGGGLPVGAAVLFARWQTVRARVTGGLSRPARTDDEAIASRATASDRRSRPAPDGARR